jgi:hypothetical protein
MKPLHVVAIIATLLVVWTAASSLRRPAPRLDLAAKKPKPTKVVYTPCTIQRAAFGGTEAAVLKIRKGRKDHYIVMDLPSEDDPFYYYPLVHYQSRWLEQSYGELEPTALVGVYPTVEEAELKAGSLCRSN